MRPFVAELTQAAPFRFCLHCTVSYGFRQSSDFAKLTYLGSEGRSTATTILSLSAARALRRDESLPTSAGYDPCSN